MITLRQLRASSSAMAAIALATAPAVAQNNRPATPVINEPFMDGQIENPADVHMETSAFSDPDAGDQHLCTDWEIWTISPPERVWRAQCVTGPEKIHAHLGDGVFEGSQAGRISLLEELDYFLRVRHFDDSGDPFNAFSNWAVRLFETGAAAEYFALETEDIVEPPTPTWRDAQTEADIVLPGGGTPPSLSLESAAGDLVLQFVGVAGNPPTLINPPPLPDHEDLRVRVAGGSVGLALPASDLTVLTEDCDLVTIVLPAVSVSAGQESFFWVASEGSTFVGNAGQVTPNFATPARIRDVPWTTEQLGYKVEIFASGFQLPVNIAFVPDPGPNPGDPFFYVTELYGTIKVVTRDGTPSVYATNLLDFNPTGNFPGSGEQGLTGIAVDPVSGDVFASMLYDAPGPSSLHFPKVVRFTSTDGGLTAATQTSILEMPNEPQGQSHQISNLQIHPGGELIVHVGDGFDSTTSQNMDSYRGKILRLELDGSPNPSNPFYDASNGINSRDYIFAYGVRNPFGGGYRAADGAQWMVENGPSIDRFAKIVEGRNFGYDGTDTSMLIFAAYNWIPATAPVNVVFIQPETFAGSGFPADKMGHAFVTESGSTYAMGPQERGKRIREYVFDANGDLVSGPTPFLRYAGVGFATAVGLAAGPDGLYFSDLYKDLNASSPIDAGANILRVRFNTEGDCNANGVLDFCDIVDGTSVDLNSDDIPDECQCTAVNYCASLPNSAGTSAGITASGSESVSLNDLTLAASGCPANKPGIFFYGTDQGQQAFGDGFRCVLGQIYRLNPIVMTDASGDVARNLDVTLPPQPAGQITAGSTWNFQFWFRDPSGPLGTGFNLTDGLAVTFCP